MWRLLRALRRFPGTSPPRPTPFPTKHGSFRQEGQLGGPRAQLSSWEIGLEEEMLVTAAVDVAATR